MPLSGSEMYWVHYEDIEISEQEIANTPVSLTELKLLDPACGSGHFWSCP